jgi:hypothetical protein
VLETPGFAPFVKVNADLGVKTIMAPWSFDSITRNIPSLWSATQGIRQSDSSWQRLFIRAVLCDLANEIILCSGILRRWFLSRVESGFAMAAGLSSAYVPYYPIGDAEESLMRIRELRTKNTVNRGLFLITGGGNSQNRLALEQFLMRLDGKDIPRGAVIVIVGNSERPKNLDRHIDGRVQFRGRVPLSDLQALLIEARAVLVPQSCGFGCMTRVPDMLCAGIPVVADEIVANSTGEIAGVDYVQDITGGWAASLDKAMRGPLFFSSIDYENWQRSARATVFSELERTCSPFK